MLELKQLNLQHMWTVRTTYCVLCTRSNWNNWTCSTSECGHGGIGSCGWHLEMRQHHELIELDRSSNIKREREREIFYILLSYLNHWVFAGSTYILLNKQELVAVYFFNLPAINTWTLVPNSSIMPISVSRKDAEFRNKKVKMKVETTYKLWSK